MYLDSEHLKMSDNEIEDVSFLPGNTMQLLTVLSSNSEMFDSDKLSWTTGEF